MDCPYTGKGDELSPANMSGSGLAVCMLISMGTLAIKDVIDIDGTCIDIEVEQPEKRIESMNLVFNMAQSHSEKERKKLERAAGLCPIESSFHRDTSIHIEYKYPEQRMNVLPNKQIKTVSFRSFGRRKAALLI